MAIKFENVSKSYGSRVVIRNCDLELSNDMVHCFFGPSGSGKTTALNLISGLVAPDGGMITGIDGARVSYVFQEDRLLPWSTVMENITFVLESRLPRQECLAEAEKYIELVNLGGFKNSYPRELSGGMRQRVALARAYAYGGDIILMDEPYKGLDYEIKKTLMDYTAKLWKNERCCMIYVTHDTREMEYMEKELGMSHETHRFPML